MSSGVGTKSAKGCSSTLCGVVVFAAVCVCMYRIMTFVGLLLRNNGGVVSTHTHTNEEQEGEMVTVLYISYYYVYTVG